MHADTGARIESTQRMISLSCSTLFTQSGSNFDRVSRLECLFGFHIVRLVVCSAQGHLFVGAGLCARYDALFIQAATRL